MTRRTLPNLARATAAAALVAGAGLAGPAAHRAHAGAAADASAADPRFGISQMADLPDQVQATSFNARWTRIPFIWHYIQPTGPTSYNPFALSGSGSDGVINSQINKGLDVVGMLEGTPPWADVAGTKSSDAERAVPVNIDKSWSPPAYKDGKPDDSGKSWSGASVNYWGNYCYMMAKRYAGKINSWIIWNEVSIPKGQDGSSGQWTQWLGTQRQYATLLEVAYKAVHAANPDAKVIMYGDPYWYDHGQYLKDLYKILRDDDTSNQYHGFFDVANLHLYIGAPSFYWIISNLRAQLKSYGWGDKQVWVSETNVEPYDDPSHFIDELHTPQNKRGFQVTMDEQAGFLVDAFATYIAAKTDRIEVYRMFDGKETTDGLAALGLVSNRTVNGKNWVRPYGQSYKFLTTLLNGFQGGSYTKGELYPDPYIGGKAGVFKVVCAKPGARITVLYNQLGAHGAYTPITASNGKKFFRADDHLPSVRYDAKDFVVLPFKENRSIRPYDTDGQVLGYDRNATATYKQKAYTTGAVTVYDKFGNKTTLEPGQTKTINTHDVAPTGAPVAGLATTTISFKDGYYYVELRGGRTYTNPDDPRIPTVGGDPVVIAEQTGGGN